MSEFHLKVTSCTRAFYDGPCASLILPTDEGEYGVLAHHESMVVGVCAGELRFNDGKKQTIAVTGSGFARIADNNVTVVVDTVELPEEVDVNRALEAKKRAEERMMLKASRQEYYRGKIAMTRAMARLKVQGKKYDR